MPSKRGTTHTRARGNRLTVGLCSSCARAPFCIIILIIIIIIIIIIITMMCDLQGFRSIRCTGKYDGDNIVICKCEAKVCRLHYDARTETCHACAPFARRFKSITRVLVPSDALLRAVERFAGSIHDSYALLKNGNRHFVLFRPIRYWVNQFYLRVTAEGASPLPAPLPPAPEPPILYVDSLEDVAKFDALCNDPEEDGDFEMPENCFDSIRSRVLALARTRSPQAVIDVTAFYNTLAKVDNCPECFSAPWFCSSNPIEGRIVLRLLDTIEAVKPHEMTAHLAFHLFDQVVFFTSRPATRHIIPFFPCIHVQVALSRVQQEKQLFDEIE